jgi:hypothetical protein
MKHLICSLQEDEAFNVSLSKAITTDAANKKHSANRPFWESKQKFELTESALKKALGDFAAFKKKGNSKETPDEEAARRLASYSHGCQGTTIVTLPGSIANQTSRSGQTQNHRPSATE